MNWQHMFWLSTEKAGALNIEIRTITKHETVGQYKEKRVR